MLWNQRNTNRFAVLLAGFLVLGWAMPSSAGD